MLICIYNLDSLEEDSPVCKLTCGEYKIGRGALLKCDDLRVGRQHAVINVKNGEATIVSTHQNPCFYQSANSKTIVVLERDCPLKISDGDKFGLIPDQFWYKFKILQDHSLNGTSHVTVLQDEDSSDSVDLLQETHVHKRNHEVDSEENPCKIPKLSNHEVEDEKESQTGSSTEDSISLRDLNEHCVLDTVSEMNETAARNLKMDEDTFDAVKIEEKVCETKQEEFAAACITSTNLDDEAAGSSNINQASIDIEEKDSKGVPSTSSDTTKNKEYRMRCKYAEKCYRKNPLHKQEFCHPGDDDYESDPNDVRPICIYDSNCYRKNKDHRNAYKHSRDAPKQTKLRKKRTSNRQQDDDSFEDDYDFDDPFLDDSEEEYVEESWSDDSDTDWKDSENIDEDENASLKKEAKRFTRKK